MDSTPEASEQSATVTFKEIGFLSGGGEMGALMRSLDWSQTAVGAIDTWPQSLRTALSILLDSGYAMYIAWGPEFTQFYNDAYRPILGAKKHPAALGQATPDCFAEIWDFIGPMFQRVMNEGKNTTLIDQVLGLDRYGYVEECYFTFSYSAIRDETGGVGGVLVTVIETTERVLDERREHTLRELASHALEATTAGQVLLRAAQALAGNPYDLPFALLYLTESEDRAILAGTAGPQLGPDEIDLSDDSATWPLGAVARGGRALQVSDLATRLGDVWGTAWPDRVSCAIVTPIFNASQAGTAGFLVTGVNPRHTLDERYRSFLESIAEQIATALVKVSAYEEEIRRAKALAELDRAKTTFFANVSHEFRTPLTLLLGPLEELLAMNGAVPVTVNELAVVSYRNGLRLQKLVNSLLDFSRIEAGRVQASYEPTDLATLTAEITSTFRSAMEKAGLQLIVECPRLPEPVYVDREMWEKIVLNLLSNALKYTFEGKVLVGLEIRDGQAVLTVEDTGAGIPEQELPKLFDRFHRVEGARGRTQEGTGIGLALVADLIKLHGGKIEVQSALGTGSKFAVSLPLGMAHLPADRLKQAETTRPSCIHSDAYVGEAARWLSGSCNTAPTEDGIRGLRNYVGDASSSAATEGALRERVLVADDNADMRDYVSRLLSDRYNVESVKNGEEALASVFQNPPDLVLSDVMMPGLDGFGLLHALRNNPETSALPVILLSARAGEESRVEGLDAGAIDYLVKPFTARELLARVGSHMEMARVRKLAAKREEALRAEAQAERDRAIAILESITDGFFTLDRDWCFTYVNPAGLQLLRATREELLGKSHWDLYPGALGTLGELEYRRAVRDRVPVVFEFLYEPFEHWYAVNAYPSQQGGLSVYFRDVTESKRAEIQLRQQWQTFDTAMSHTPDQLYTFDLEGRFTYANRAVLALWQKPLEEMLGKNFFDLGAPAQIASHLYSQIQNVIETKEPLRDHAAFAGASGETRHYEYIFVPVLAANGYVEAVAGSTRDITDREHIENALAASKQKLQQVFAQAPVAIVALRGRDFIVELANPPYRALLKGSALQGDRFADLVPELGRDVWEALHRVFDTGEPFVANEWLIPYDADEDGLIEDHWFNVVFNPLSEVDGSVSGMIAVLTDVTAQVLARQDLERVNRGLEEFAHAASHDMQEPLRMVNTYTELLLRRHISPDNRDAQAYAGFIYQGVRRMEQLIPDLLSYSRALHRGDLIPNADNAIADLNTSWAEAVTVLSGRIGESGAHIKVGPLPTVRGDMVQLSHVFQNLLSNALKYRRGTIPPEVSVSSVRKDGNWVVAVKDNGIGFEPQYAERIFGLFKRLHRDEYPGTGLGLAISQRIVERYRGRIWAESQPEVGSIFYVELPAVD